MNLCGETMTVEMGKSKVSQTNLDIIRVSQHKYAIRITESIYFSIFIKRLTTHNTPPIDLHVLWPIRLGLSAFFKWKYMYKAIYFLNHQDILYQYNK